ncbi:MAG: DUF971 domain-containing protein [Pirellulaceae bacterium]|nr:DUF971 domain-containing protein [Pirellulaceae bacterium]
MNYHPTDLTLIDQESLKISWSDGCEHIFSVRSLRDACPCASCREKRAIDTPAELLPVLTVEEAQPLRIQGMRPVGNYAYAIAFSDGHDTGIFTLEFLRELGSGTQPT